MELRLERFFGPTAFRPLSVLKSIENSSHILINAIDKFTGPLPDWDYLSVFKKLESMHIYPRPGECIDFASFPPHVNLKKLSMGRSVGKGAKEIKGWRKFTTLEELILERTDGYCIDAKDFPPHVKKLELKSPMRFDVNSISELNVHELKLIAPTPWKTDAPCFLQNLPQLKKLNLLYISGMTRFPVLSNTKSLSYVGFDNMRNLSDISGLMHLESLNVVFFWGCPKLDYDTLLTLRQHPSLVKLQLSGQRLAARLKAAFPPHIEVVGHTFISG